MLPRLRQRRTAQWQCNANSKMSRPFTLANAAGNEMRKVVVTRANEYAIIIFSLLFSFNLLMFIVIYFI